jgi:hypothetical protein
MRSAHTETNSNVIALHAVILSDAKEPSHRRLLHNQTSVTAASNAGFLGPLGRQCKASMPEKQLPKL